MWKNTYKPLLLKIFKSKKSLETPLQADINYTLAREYNSKLFIQIVYNERRIYHLWPQFHGCVSLPVEGRMAVKCIGKTPTSAPKSHVNLLNDL